MNDFYFVSCSRDQSYVVRWNFQSVFKCLRCFIPFRKVYRFVINYIKSWNLGANIDKHSRHCYVDHMVDIIGGL